MLSLALRPTALVPVTVIVYVPVLPKLWVMLDPLPMPALFAVQCRS